MNLKLCPDNGDGGYNYESVLNNRVCRTIGNNFWCNVARQYVALQLNLLREDCGDIAAFSFDQTGNLLATVRAAGDALCSESPFREHSDWTLALTLFNEGRSPNGPCHCGDPGCNDPVQEDPEAGCELRCVCDVETPNESGECSSYCTYVD